MLPTDAKARKELPIASGVLDYFPDALARVAELSRAGNEQHNPGQPLHHDRDKSGDEADALIRHFLERGTIDTDGIPHSAKVAWRALALLQKEEEERHNLPLPRGARSTAKQAREQKMANDVAHGPKEQNAEVPLFKGDKVRIRKGARSEWGYVFDEDTEGYVMSKPGDPLVVGTPFLWASMQPADVTLVARGS